MDDAHDVAVLFAEPRGVYSTFDGVDLWDEARDARRYRGPLPVVAHPPCNLWINFAALNYSRWGGEHNRPGNDGGCFREALRAVNQFGGVLEHPAYSNAFKECGLGKPPREGGWVKSDSGFGHICYVEQGRYGHPARKATWLYAAGVELPELRWGYGHQGEALVGWCRNHVPETETRPRVGKKQAAATPRAFAEVLLQMARTAKRG